MKNKKWCCADCNSTNIEVQGWIDVNSGQVISEDNYYYCNDCEDNIKHIKQIENN